MYRTVKKFKVNAKNFKFRILFENLTYNLQYNYHLNRYDAVILKLIF